jgi:hypothetical protein
MRAWVMVFLVAGCGDDPKPPEHHDLSVPQDFSVALDMSVFDFTYAGPDIAHPTFDLTPGAVGDAGVVACAPGAGGNTRKYVVNQLTLPQSRTDYAFDLNGDGKLDNQLGNIIGALAQQNLNPQLAMDLAVAAGSDVMLLQVDSSDATFVSDACARSTWANGVPQSSPDFSGNGTFAVDNSLPRAPFYGPIAGGAFASQSPAVAAQPVQYMIQIVLFSGPIFVPVTAGRASFTISASGLMTGRLNGAMRKQDVDGILVPAIAADFEMQIQANPTSSNSQQLLSLFDNGGTASTACGTACQNPNGSCAVANDQHISVCEVGSNAIIKNVLAPDVDMHDAAGNWAPNPANTDKDSLSVGFAFTAVKASF